MTQTLLTTEMGKIRVRQLNIGNTKRALGFGKPRAIFIFLERETGFEPATSTLARSHSTTELFPLKSERLYPYPVPRVKCKNKTIDKKW